MIRFISLIVLLLTSSVYANAACDRYTAPYPFPNKPQSWGNDSGPIVSGGFVDSKRPSGGVYDAQHGIDVSVGDNVDYSKLASCGGKFAVVRINHSITKNGQVAGPIDEQFASHIREFSAHNIAGIPYFYFSLPRSFKQLQALNKVFPDDEFQSYRQRYTEFGRKAAEVFLKYVEQLTTGADAPAVGEASIAGLRAKFVALDVEELPTDAEGRASTTTSRKNYGRLYAAAVCAWISRIRIQEPGFVPILYTFPAIYGDYLQYALPEDYACLQGLPVWIARTYGNGWEAIRDPDTSHCAKHESTICTTDRYVKLTCEVQSGNRCIVHQYTHRGTPFALGPREKNGFPRHFDFDRFYVSKISPTNSTPQYVRVEDSFR